MRNGVRGLPVVLLVWLGVAVSSEARVERLEILSRTDVREGKTFGEAGAFEKVIGKVHFAVKPDDAANKLVVDLDKAPRNAAGEVEFASDVFILRPKDVARANGTVLLEIPNRGGKGMLRVIQDAKGSPNPSKEEEFGDGFLMQRGVTLVWLGWQWDVRDEANLLRLYAPVAHEGDGRTITGLVRSDFVPDEKVPEYPLGHLISGQLGGTEYACSDAKDPANVLTVRDAPMAPRRTIPRSEWEFAGTPELRAIRLKGGFEAGKVYEVVYRAKDPVIAGLGLAAVRDFASYMKQPGNDATPAAQHIYSLGISQSGRFLRHFLRDGFNADEAGKRAIDAMSVHVAGAGVGSFNHRFAQPSRDGQPTQALFYPTDIFPFSDTPQRDPITGQTAGLLDRAKAANVLPKIFYTNTSYEYWSRAGALVHTSTDGKSDVPLLDNVRIYLLAGLEHFTVAFPPVQSTERGLASRYPPNPNPVLYFWRALFVAMDNWVRNGMEPPASRYPKLADHTLVRREELKFPKIPKVQVPPRMHQALQLDFGPQWKNRIITKQPPGLAEAFPAFVPQVDKAGNDLGGVRLPELEVPLATYTGWNLRDPKNGMPNERISFLGSWFPLPKTKQESEASGDSRQPIADRYKDREDYLQKFSAAANKLADERFLLKEDVEALVRRGGEEWDYITR